MTWFGFCNSTTGALDAAAEAGNTGLNNYTLGNNHSVWPLQCPSTGAQSISDLKTYCRASSGTGAIRMAVFNSAKNDLIAQGDAEATVTTTAGWFGHTSFTGSNLVGGDYYTLVVTIDTLFSASDLYFYTDWDTDYGIEDSSSADFTAGFSDTSLSGTGTSIYKIALRCGVAAAGATNLSIFASECVGSEGMFG